MTEARMNAFCVQRERTVLMKAPCLVKTAQKGHGPLVQDKVTLRLVQVFVCLLVSGYVLQLCKPMLKESIL